MPSSNWSNIEIKLPEGLEEIGGTISEITSVVAGLLEAVKTLAEAALQFIPDELNARALALEALTTAAQQALDSLVSSTGAYMLMVPISKPIPEEYKRYLPNLDLGSEQEAINSRQKFPEDASAQPDASGYTASLVQLVQNQAWQTYYDAVNNNTGGNYGFLRSTISSLSDKLDQNRPQFNNPDDQILAGVLLMGAQDASSIYQDIKRLAKLFNIAPEGSATGNVLPLPSNLKLILMPTDASAQAEVLVSWNLLDLGQLQNTFLKENVVTLAEYAVIKSDNPEILGASSVIDLFGTADLTENLEKNGHKVVKLGTNPAADYTDTAGVEFNKRYYYCVAYNYALDDVPQGFGSLSGVKSVLNYPELPPTRGIPPDWVRTPSILESIPAFKQVIDLLQTKISQFGNFEVSGRGNIQAYVDYLAAEADKYTKFATDIASAIANLAYIIPEAGVYFKTIETSGGNSGFVVELLNAFADKSDSGRPPFDNGDEAVFGIIFLAGAPTKAELLGLKTLFDLLFVSPDSSQLGAIQQALADVQGSLADIASIPAPSIGLSDSTTQESPSLPAGSVAIPPTPTFGKDMKVN